MNKMENLLTFIQLRKKYPDIRARNREDFLRELGIPVLPSEDIRAIRSLLKKPVRKLSDSDVRSYLRKHKVYVTLTSDPERVKILPMMLSLLDTKHVDEIHVNLPRKYRNEISYDNADIKELKKVPKVRVFRPPKDLGPITKMLPTLRRIKDKDAIVISIDDDVVYPRGIINEHIYQSIKTPDEITSGDGFSFYDFPETKKKEGYKVKSMDSWWPQEAAEWPYIDVAEGFSSVAYKKRLVNLKKLDKLNAISKFCKLSDDLTINYTLAADGVMRRLIDNKYSRQTYIHPLAMGEEKGLHTQKPPGRYWDYNVYKYVECLNGIRESGY